MHISRLLILLSAFLISCIATSAEVTVGAARPGEYLPLLKDKRVALLSNHTGLIDGRHTLDTLLSLGVNVTVIFSPEHGFRGTADAGEHVAGSVDKVTGIPIASLYNGSGSRMPSREVMDRFDIIVTDIQDVGLRFYTYYITMLDLMDAAAAHNKEFMVLDRPNPNGMTVDGPILDMTLKSGVGRLPIPVLHGMTLGELALMIKGEGWLTSSYPLSLTVIPCEGYTHATRYTLPVAPSPNLPDMQAIYLYPSTCLFEGTVMSLGRGTEYPFTIYGHPAMSGCSFSFTPKSRPGAKNPPLLNRRCFGHSLRTIPADSIIAHGLDLSYIIEAYRNPGMKKQPKFFTPFFDKLIGNSRIRQLIEQGYSAERIQATWANDVLRFKEQRRPYLLYPES